MMMKLRMDPMFTSRLPDKELNTSPKQFHRGFLTMTFHLFGPHSYLHSGHFHHLLKPNSTIIFLTWNLPFVHFIPNPYKNKPRNGSRTVHERSKCHGSWSFHPGTFLFSNYNIVFIMFSDNKIKLLKGFFFSVFSSGSVKTYYYERLACHA
jgi:hypothetical protein